VLNGGDQPGHVRGEREVEQRPPGGLDGRARAQGDPRLEQPIRVVVGARKPVLVGQGQCAHDAGDAGNGLAIREPEEVIRLPGVELLQRRDDIRQLGPGHLGMAGGREHHRHRRRHVGVGLRGGRFARRRCGR